MRVKRQQDEPKIPKFPGWYPDGSGHLRYFDGLAWTERQRELPRYRDIPEFTSLPPYQRGSSIPPPRRHRGIRRVVGAVAVFALLVTAITQIGSIWAPNPEPATGYVPLITDAAFVTQASRICRKDVSTSDSLALTGARLNSLHNGYVMESSPYVGLSSLGLKDASSHNTILLRAIAKAASAFAAMAPIPGSQSAVGAFQAAWHQAVADVAAYNQALRDRSGTTRTLYHQSERDLEWINVFSTANQVPSCAVFSTQLFS